MSETTPAAPPLPLPTALTFSLASLPTASLWLAISIYLPRHFATHLGLSLTMVGAAFATVRLLDVGVDPLLGLAMDRTRTRLGRYRVWMIAGAPVLMASVAALFLAPAGISSAYLVGWLLVLYLGTSLLTLSYAAWGSTLATDYHGRSRLFGLAAPVGVVGSLTILMIPSLAKTAGHTDAEAVRAMGWFIIVLTPIVVALVAWRTPERITPDAHGQEVDLREFARLLARPALLRLFLSQMSLTMGPGWLSALYLFFATDALGFTIAQASGLLVAGVLGGAAGGPAFARLSRRIGKHRTLMGATVAYGLGLSAFLLVPHGAVWAAALVMLFLGCAQTGFGLMTQAMMADVGDEVRLDLGRERMGLLYSLITLATKLAGALAIGLTYPLLAAIGFQAADGAVNPPSAILGLKLAYLVGPSFFVLLGGACFIGWRLDAARHADIRRRLDERDAALDAQAG